MIFPNKQEFKRFLSRLPRWIVLMIVIMLFGRLLLILLFSQL